MVSPARTQYLVEAGNCPSCESITHLTVYQNKTFFLRSKSIDKEKKAPRGRPRKIVSQAQQAPSLAPPILLQTPATVMQQPLAPPKTTPNKKETVKKVNARAARNTRIGSNFKSRETLPTSSSSADDGPSPVKQSVPVAVQPIAVPTTMRLPIISPKNKLNALSANDKNSNYMSSPASRDG